jgi:hypothetical protein
MLIGLSASILLVRLSPLLIWLACHFVGDFAFQSTWMSVEKGKSWEINFYHCATYTATFVLFAHPSFNGVILLLTTHFVVDTLKARYKVIGSIWLDQLLHVATIVAILLSGV